MILAITLLCIIILSYQRLYSRSLSHSHFNTSQNADDSGSKTNQNIDELSGIEKGYSKFTGNSESRRSSLNRVLETIINESYDNPNVNLSGKQNFFQQDEEVQRARLQILISMVVLS